MICCSLQVAGTYSSGVCFMCAISFIIGVCVFLTAFITDLEVNLKELNEEITASNRFNGSFTRQKGLRQKFSEIIQFYLDAKMFVCFDLR